MISRLTTFFVTLFAIALHTVATAQTAPAITIGKRFGGSGDDHPGKFMQLPDKGYLISGWTMSNNDQVANFHAGSDAYLLRIDSAGNFMWGRAIGGSGEENIFSVDILDSNTYIVAGKTLSNDGDMVSLGGPSAKGFIAWINASTGTIRKIKLYTGDLSGEVKKVIVLDSGKMVVFGQRVCTTPIQTMWVTMMDTAGNVIWQKPYGRGTCCTTGEVLGPFVAKKHGGFMATAMTSSVDGDVHGLHGESNVWMVSLDDTGRIEWAKCYGGSGSCGPIGLAESPDGTFVCGANTSVNDSDVHGTHGGLDFWAFKVDDTGKILWSRAIGGTANEFLGDAAGTCDGGMIMSGYSWSNDGDITAPHGIFDVFLARVDSVGGIEWTHNYGTSLGESEGYVTVTRDNGYAFLGFLVAEDGDATGLAVHGGGDIWFGKLADDTLRNYCPTADTVVVHPIGVENVVHGTTTVAVYPIPAYNTINIAITGNNDAATIALHDVTGRLVVTQQLAPHTSSYTLPVSGIANGWYTLTLTGSSGRATAKVCIQH